jgi:hypothetical protein
MRSAGAGRTYNPLRVGASWLAGREALPTALRAVLGFYGSTGSLDYSAIRLRSAVDEAVEEMIESAFADVEAALAAEFEVDDVTFEYDTKLTLPAELTLGYLYRQLGHPAAGGDAPTDDPEIRRAEDVTALIVEALIDGDMRDARNDEEYEDFEVSLDLAAGDLPTVARIAQETLQASIEDRLADYPESVTGAYERAVEISESHQDEDDYFRELWDGEDADAEAIRAEYKHAGFEEPPALFDERILELPYFKTQYERVGVIYEGMFGMYRGAGFDIPDDFEKSIVLAIVGAQVWLDDVADYRDDLAEGQLTPVTAEYLLADDDGAARETVVEIARAYLELAQEFARSAGTPMAGIAVEYIERSGDPSALPR